MPGKVNPVICESVLQVCAQVIANDLAVTLGGLGSILELNLIYLIHGFLFLFYEDYNNVIILPKQLRLT